MSEQCIKCDVCACAHNKDGCDCNLDAIRVTCGNAVDTAHYCGDYKERENFQN